MLPGGLRVQLLMGLTVLLLGSSALAALLVENVMTRDVHTVDPDESILVVAEKLIGSPFRRFVVMERNRVVGQISRRDVLRALDHLCKTKKQH